MQVAAPTPPTPPQPPSAPIVVSPRVGGVTVTNVPGGPADVLRAFKARGEELHNQLDRLGERREEITDRLNDHQLDATDRTGLQGQLAEIDGRITSLNRQIAANDEAVAQAAGIPGAVVPDPEPIDVHHNDEPPAAMIVTIVMTVFVFFPLALAYARRLWKRPVAAPAALPPEIVERMARLEQAVDAVAVEVERIGEGQRFVTKLFAESPRATAELPQRT